jgi:hypothetical protein
MASRPEDSTLVGFTAQKTVPLMASRPEDSTIYGFTAQKTVVLMPLWETNPTLATFSIYVYLTILVATENA